MKVVIDLSSPSGEPLGNRQLTVKVVTRTSTTTKLVRTGVNGRAVIDIPDDTLTITVLFDGDNVYDKAALTIPVGRGKPTTSVVVARPQYAAELADYMTKLMMSFIAMSMASSMPRMLSILMGAMA